jgi:hypothetical protein
MADSVWADSTCGEVVVEIVDRDSFDPADAPSRDFSAIDQPVQRSGSDPQVRSGGLGTPIGDGNPPGARRELPGHAA